MSMMMIMMMMMITIMTIKMIFTYCELLFIIYFFISANKSKAMRMNRQYFKALIFTVRQH